MAEQNPVSSPFPSWRKDNDNDNDNNNKDGGGFSAICFASLFEDPFDRPVNRVFSVKIS